MGVDLIHDFMKPLGFGQITGIDINGEVRGVLPTDWKRLQNAHQQKWYAGETISLGIGQGYNSFTMLQLAHATATVANAGVKIEPQLVNESSSATPMRAPTPASRSLVVAKARQHRRHPQGHGGRDP